MITEEDVLSALPLFARGVTVKVRQHPKDYRVFEVMIFDPRPNQKPKTFAFNLMSEVEEERRLILEGCVKKFVEQVKNSGLLRAG